jgi:Immunity protein 21
VTEFQLQWMASEGGPLLLLAAPLLVHWEGADPPSAGRAVSATFRATGPGTPATDYDRACDVPDELGVLEVGPGHGLVLGDEPAATAWWPLPDGGLLVRWHHAESEAAVLAALRAAPLKGFGLPTCRFSVSAAPLMLFDAALPGPEAQRGAHLWLTVPVGEYTVTTADHRPDRATSLTLHRFVPRRSHGEAGSP